MQKIVDNYPKFLEENLAVFEPMFQKAFETSEFNLILSLLAIRGLSDTGWEPLENTEDIFEEIYKQQRKFKRFLKMNMNLWLYLHLIESSEQYELLANLLKTIKGKDYVVANHVNKNFVNLKVEQKITRLKKIAKGTEFENVHIPFTNAFDSRLRNAIGHADYALKKGDSGGVTIIDDAGFPKIFNIQEVNDYINRAVALHVAIRTLRASYIGHYQKSTKIMSSSTFGHGSPIEVRLIVRKGHGVVGFRCVGGYDNGKPFESRTTTTLPYEQKLIAQGMNDLPKSRIKRINQVLRYLPTPVSKRLAPILGKIINR